MPDIRNILCPVDFSETSDYALRYGVELAERLGASVHIVHAYQLVAYGLVEAPIVPAADYIEKLTTELKKALEETAARHKGGRISIQSTLVEGHPALENRARRRRAARRLDRHGHARSNGAQAPGAREHRGASGSLGAVPRAHGATARRGDEALMAKGRVLIVDDEANARAALAELLREEGYESRSRRTASRRCAQARGAPPDVV